MSLSMQANQGERDAESIDDAPLEERISDAIHLVQQACRQLGGEHSSALFKLRLARALAMNLLDELSLLETTAKRRFASPPDLQQ